MSRKLLREIKAAQFRENHPGGKYCGDQMCCWGPRGKKPK